VNLCDNLTVAENVMLGHEPRRAGGIDWVATRRKAREYLARMSLDIDPTSSLGAHSLAVRQLVAICRAMVVDAKVLILDEPTSSLDADEVAELFAVVRQLRDEGVAVLFVSHFIEQVYAISDRMTVLRNGTLVGEYMTAELSRLELVSKMVGTSLEDLSKLEVAGHGGAREAAAAPLMTAVGLGRRGGVEAFDLEVYPGQVLGLAGLLGSGRTELARLLFGADRSDRGTLSVNGEEVRLRNPGSAMARDITYSSEDRKAEGIVADLTVRDNIVEKYITALDIRPANPNVLARNLSGGNQQKVLLARWLATAPKMLILDEPTRGIDVGAKAEIQRLVADLAREGMAVVFISAELEEVIRLSHRIAVMRDRAKVAELINEDVTVDDVVKLIASGGQPR
jgi:simple sugar transport system ATP-binding protein